MKHTLRFMWTLLKPWVEPLYLTILIPTMLVLGLTYILISTWEKSKA